MVRITPNRWTGRPAHRTRKAIQATRSFSLIGTLLLTALAFIGSAKPVHAYCPPSHLCYKKTVAIQTAGSTQGIPCNTMNGGLLDFGSLPRDGSGSVTLRVCVCPTDAQFPWSGTTGIDFLGITIGDPNDFTIIDSGTVTQGVAAQMPGANGCNNGIPFYDNGNGFPGCGSGNPTNYCYADIQFKPIEYGTFMPTVNIGAACPGSNTSDVPADCIIYPPGAIYDYQAEPVTLKGIGSGFAMLQPTNGTVLNLSAPKAITDPGSATVTFQAQIDSTVSVTWDIALRYQPSGRGVGPFSVPGTLPKTTGTEQESKTYTGQGGFLSVKALAEKASASASVPIAGWATGTQCTSGSPPMLISQELKSLYNFSPPGSNTPQLLERLANTESSYNQFVKMYQAQPKTDAKSQLPSVYALWPDESPETQYHEMGDFIGLMQVPNSEDAAWNWFHNAQVGADTFEFFIDQAESYQARILGKDKLPSKIAVLPTPSSGVTGLEQVAVGRYKGFAPPRYYWVPQCSTKPFSWTCPYTPPTGNCVGGSWSWIVNPCSCPHSTLAGTCDDQDDVIIQVDKITNTTAPCEQ